MGQVYECWWRICRGIMFFFFSPVSNIACFTFYIHLLTIPRKAIYKKKTPLICHIFKNG
jgi:hypothetical protein